MSIASEIARLQAAKVDIMAALVEKGVDVTGKNLADVPGLIDSIVPPEEGLVIDGLKYRTVVMPDGREWMAENLSVYISGARFYNDNETLYGRNGKNYGRLYPPFADFSSIVEGWRLPTKDEIALLVNSIGGMASARYSLKDKSWGGGTDLFGFSMLPCGYCSYNFFDSVGTFGCLLTSTNNGNDAKFGLSFFANGDCNYNRNTSDSLVSVRLIKDV